MKSVGILHVGDIHYPDLKEGGVHADIKDKGLSAWFVQQLAPNRMMRVSEALVRLLSEDPDIRGVLISGDLTTKGDLDGYQQCVSYLTETLDLRNTTIWKDRFLHVVPGNHDIRRKDIIKGGTDLFKKFRPLEAMWEATHARVLEGSYVRETSIRHKGCVVLLLSLNTCMGCGETRYLPAKIKEELSDLLEKYVADHGDLGAFDLIGEQLDTPAVLDDHLNQLEGFVRGLGNAGVPIVLGHHAVLPQTEMRVDLYTELLNAGFMRARLCSLDVPVIYCHGHIHKDPIEIVDLPTNHRGKLLALAAPLYREGFNLLRLFFNDSGVPIGCEVTPYRFEDHGSVRAHTRIEIPLVHRARAATVCGSRSAEILRQTSGMPKRLQDIRAAVQRATGKAMQEPTLARHLRELEWLGMVELQNRDEMPRHWQVRRVEP